MARLRKRAGCILILLIPVLSGCLLGSFLLGLGYLHDSDTKAFENTLLEAFGLRKVTYTFTIGNPPFPSADSGAKIGFHIGDGGLRGTDDPDGTHYDIEYWIRRLDAAGTPVFLKTVNETGPLVLAQELARTSGVPHILIFRSTVKDAPEYDLPPAEAAVIHWELHKSQFPAELDKNLVWFETVNEVDKNRAEWLAEFSLETAKLAIRDGYKWLAFGWSTGEPEREQWEGPKMLEFLRFVAAHPNQLGIALHEYSLDARNIRAQYPFLIGRFQALFEVADANSIPRPPIFITEWGWEATRVPSPELAAADIAWANTIYAQHPEIKGAAIWGLVGGFGGIADQTVHLIKPVTAMAVGLPSSDPPPGNDDDPTIPGFDPSIVVQEVAAKNWINGRGGSIDLGIQLAILEGESNGGGDMGTCSGLESAAKLSQNEVVAAKLLLLKWQTAAIRDWSDIARTMVREDYSDYTGHCAAGEIGPNGILPTTGIKICEGLSQHDSDVVKSCNFFDQRVAPFAKGWWLNAIGYRFESTDDEKFQQLYGWNHSESYRRQLVSRANEINQYIADNGLPIGTGPIKIGSITYWTYPKDTPFWKLWMIKLVQYTGLLGDLILLPEGMLPTLPGGNTPPPTLPPGIGGDMVHPHPGSYLCGYHYGEPVGNGIHWGIDLCTGGVSMPVYAMHSGRVTFSRYLDRAEPLAGEWWISGYVVAIEGVDDKGNQIWTAYGHGASQPEVAVDQNVEAGQLLFMSGTTGFSSGIHLHLAMKVNGQWVNPSGYLP